MEVKLAIQPDTRKRGIVLKGSFRGLLGCHASAERSAIIESGSGSRRDPHFQGLGSEKGVFCFQATERDTKTTIKTSQRSQNSGLIFKLEHEQTDVHRPNVWFTEIK